MRWRRMTSEKTSKRRRTSERGRFHGSVPGFDIGDRFATRDALFDSGVHGRSHAGIDYVDPEDGAYAVLVNCEYSEDQIFGQVARGCDRRSAVRFDISYVGAGFVRGGHVQEDMRKTAGNLALFRNAERNLPVRVVLGPARSKRNREYVYAGLYHVTEAIEDRDGKTGKLVYRFRMRRARRFDPAGRVPVQALLNDDRRVG